VGCGESWHCLAGTATDNKQVDAALEGQQQLEGVSLQSVE